MSEKVSVIEDHGLRCVQCLYNLTGLTSGICPECGWTIDWRIAADPEARRIGTRAFRAHGASLFPATLFTIASMLFTPWRFAEQLRVDEPLAPALLVAVGSFATLWWSSMAFVQRAFGSGRWLLYVPIVAVVVAVDSLWFATLSGRATSPRWSWRWRLRFYLLVGLYSTFFVSTWSLVGGPPILVGTANVWPMRPIGVSPGPWLGVNLIFYWWLFILAVVLFIRNRPRWLAALVFLPAFGVETLITWMFYISFHGMC